MERPKRWQLFLIVSVLLLTVYNILPTLFFYTKPLKAPINAQQADKISAQIAGRVSDLEKESIDWIRSFCKLLGVKPNYVHLDPKNPQLIQVGFTDVLQARKFRTYFPKAGSLISFSSAQLALNDTDPTNKDIVIKRRIPISFKESDTKSYFQYSTIKNEQGAPTPLYRALTEDRISYLGSLITGPSENSSFIQLSLSQEKDPAAQELLLQVGQNLLQFCKIFEKYPSIRSRYFASFSQNEIGDKKSFIHEWTEALDRLRDELRAQKLALTSAPLDQNNLTLNEQKIQYLTEREKIAADSSALIKKYIAEFSAGMSPLDLTSFASLVKSTPFSNRQTFSFEQYHPFIESMTLDWDQGCLILNLYPDIEQLRKEKLSLEKEQIDQFLFNDIAHISRESGEKLQSFVDQFLIELKELQEAQSFIAFRLYNVAKATVDTLKDNFISQWSPRHPDLQRDVFPIWDYETYKTLSPSQKKLGLLIFSPATQNQIPPRGFKMNSIYIVAKGIDKIIKRYEDGKSEAAQLFLEDFNSLRQLLEQSGFIGYSADAYVTSPDFKGDFIFEHSDYYQDLLNATREKFSVHGTKRMAVLEFSNLEQRILTENKIDNQIHEDLLRWRDDYRAAQIDLRGTSRFDVPAPTQNAFWSNFKLSLKKYFRGDERKIIRWGLDLSGGKTIQIELRDAGGRVVTHENDIRQATNELYSRVNKMGVAEVSIRQEGNTISLDFPGSQSFSAAELVKASSMHFHIINEKFMLNPTLRDATHRFLQEVWNEAVVTGKKELDDINAIAWRHLYGDSSDLGSVQPRSISAKTLYNNGLRLAAPEDTFVSSTLEDTISKIAIFRGDDYRDWHGQTHPLVIVFKNYALEGASLDNIRASYDPSKGNFLAFSVKSSGKGSTLPQQDLYAWTSKYAKEKITGTPLAADSQGHGWRMAVILNGSVITCPTLDSALKDSASITGSFTQREVNRLESDLKAGSLSFTPRILSEKNVSPELGAKERMYGILATVISLALAIGTMIFYYRFGGVIASIAVIINLFIMWAAFQNLGATLTLAGIAGIILTVAMAVDANVLVFERIREEFAITGRIASAVHAGYRKAFSAILDSNITTLIAALILLNFDAGPIRGFAVPLIIGIISSLFTALFMTRFFFSWWVLNPKHQKLTMMNLIKSAHFNFLKFTKPTVIVSAIVILLGSVLLLTHRQSMLGMDFTGGYALTIDLPVSQQKDYRSQVESALLGQGLLAQDFQVRELNPSNQVRLFLSRSLEEKSKPFYELAATPNQGGYAFESNPKIVWIVEALQKSGIQLSNQTLETLDTHWTSVSGQMSDTMRNSALIGMSIALICILVYITLRFEFKYAISATLCLVHDVIFCLGMIAILNRLGVAIQIDLHTVAALMTIVGYSLNDTIIVFDRIREDMKQMRRRSLSEIINHALNVTLSRTLMTSGITLLVLIPLIFLGGSTLFGFALVMAIGIIFGTLSSLFIAAPLMQYFHHRQMQKQGVFITDEP